MKWYWRAARIPVLAYLGCLGFLFFAQAGFIFPGRATQGKPDAEIKTRTDAELLTLTTSSGDTIKALYGAALSADGKPAADAAQRPTLLFFYGNAMCLNHSRSLHSDFRRLGFNVMIPEYVGYGISSGAASELGCYETADAAYDYLLSHGVVAKKLVIAGWSLGGAVAIDLGSRKPAAGVAAFSTFTRLAAMGHVAFPFYPTPFVAMILRHRFESLSKIPAISCPLLIGHSRGDRIIPFFMSDELAAAARSSVTRLSLDKPDHDAFFVGGGAKVTTAISEFVERVTRSK